MGYNIGPNYLPKMWHLLDQKYVRIELPIGRVLGVTLISIIESTFLVSHMPVGCEFEFPFLSSGDIICKPTCHQS